MKQKVHYINIEESLKWNLNFDGTSSLKMERQACIQRADDKEATINNVCRIYYKPSEASILRLAKIQEKLAG